MVAQVGLTGGIGSGKSTAAKLFAQLGVEVIDADQVARELTAQGTSHYQDIVNYFGRSIINASQDIDRKKLGEIVFNDRQKLEFLEQLLHPPIRKVMRERAAVGTAIYCVLEIPLLIENQQYREMDRVVVVTCNTAEKIRRLVPNRDLDKETIKKIIGNQLSDQERIRHADDVICNDGTLKQLEDRVISLHKQYLRELRIPRRRKAHREENR